MALAGIGGNSIDEVKNNLTAYEVAQWREYRHRRGSLNIGRRIEQVMGGLLAFYLNIGVKDENAMIEPLTLMPHEDDVEISFEEQMLMELAKEQEE